MENVKIEQCVNQLSKDVSEKIIKAQNKSCSTLQPFDLPKRVVDPHFRSKLFLHLGRLEKKYLPCFIEKYGFYQSDQLEELATTEEKLALLLLQQKGIIYKIQLNDLNHSFIIPKEMIESYFNTIFDHVFSTPVDDISTKKYIFILMELLSVLKSFNGKHKVKLENQFDNSLLAFLISNQLVEKQGRNYTVIDRYCDQFFQKSNQEIKSFLALFIFATQLKSNYWANFIVWALSNRGGVNRDRLFKMIDAKYHQKLLSSIKFLEEIEVISCNEEGIFFFL